MSKFKMLEQVKEGRMRMKIYMTKKTERTTKKIKWMRQEMDRKGIMMPLNKKINWLGGLIMKVLCSKMQS